MSYQHIPSPEPEASAGDGLSSFAKRHRKGLIVTLVTLVILGVGAYAVARVATMALSVRDLQSIADQAQSHASAGDLDALAADLTHAQRKASAARGASEDLAVRAAGRLPWIGDDVRALRLVSEVSAELTGSTSSLVTLLPHLKGQDLAGDGSGFDLTLLADVRTAMTGLQTAATSSSKKLEKLDDLDVHAALRTKIDTVQQALSKVSPAVDKLDPLMTALPIILGQDGERTWFVTMQNLTEARPSGGLLSAYVILRADHGKLEVLDEGNNDDLVAGPPVPYAATMPQGYQDVWGDSLSSWLSMNLSASFPDNATLIRNGWNARGEQQVDSVLAFGQGVLPYLAAAVGPVHAGDKTVDPADLTEYLTVGVYRDYPDPAKKDAVVGAIIDEIFTKLSAGSFDLKSLVSTALTLDSGDALQMWSSDSAVQRGIVAAGFSGELTEELGPVSSVRVINAGGNKLDAFTTLAADYELGACTVDDDANETTRQSTLTVTVGNTAPTSGLPAYMTGRLDLPADEMPTVGSNHDYVVVYAPVDASMETFTLDGEPAFVQQNEASGREFAVYDVELEPGQSRTLTTTWQEPARDDEEHDLALRPQVLLQPMLLQPAITGVTGVTCG